ncbi:MAG TPA: hypothetical protein VLB46_01105 [Pyrinomonadaceae bacterium]|nr:hypothetical protein [Pyrinomonadaceae bacterium]
MTIRTHFFEVKEMVSMSSADAQRLQLLSIRATLGGQNSHEWKVFMEQFAENELELARLTGVDGTMGDPAKDKARAYLVSNAFFGLTNNSSSILDALDSDLPYGKQTRVRLDENDFNLGALTLTDQELTPDLLLNSVGPLLKAVGELQRLIDQTHSRMFRGITIKSVSQNSPIEVSLGGAAEAIEQIKATVVPWRRKHDATMALLTEEQKRIEIKSLQADVLEKEGKQIRDHAEAEKVYAEADKLRAEAERTRLENEKLRVELHQARIQLVLDILSKVAPNTSEIEKLDYVVKLLPPIETLTTSEMIP